MTYNSGGYNHAGYNSLASYPVPVVALTDYFTPLSEASSLVIVYDPLTGAGTDGKTFGQAPYIGGGFNGATFNGGGFNSWPAQESFETWSIVARSTVSDALTISLTETAQIRQRVVIDLSSGATNVRVDTLTFDVELNTRGTCSFELVDQGGGMYRPQVGHEVRIIDYDGVTVLFAGSIERTDETIQWQADGNHYLFIRCEAVGWEQIFDRYIVPDAVTIEDQQVGEIVDDLLSTATASLLLDGFSTVDPGTISWGPVIESFSVQYDRLSDAFTRLCEAAGYWWRVKHDKVLTFYDPGAATASGVTFSKTSANWLSMSSARDRSQYRNTQYITNALKLSTPTQSFSSDGVKRSWVLDYAVYSATKVVNNGTDETIGIEGVDTGKQWYYTVGSKTVNIDDGEPTPAVGSVSFHVTAQEPIVLKYADGAEISERIGVEANSGVYENAYTEPVVLAGTDAVGLLAQALVDQYAPIGKTVTIVTDTSGILPGETVALDVAEMDLVGTYFVSRVSASDVAGKRLRYTVTCHSAVPEQAWRAVFQRKVQSGLRNSQVVNYP